MIPATRREFLADVGKGMLAASVGYGVACDLGLLPAAFAEEGAESLSFGPLEPLVCLMQETPVDQLLPKLVDRLRSGTSLLDLVSAAALANARTFGGEDYVGFHTLMALAPAYHMALELPEDRRPLPVFKTLYRNTNRIQEKGSRSVEVLKKVSPAALPGAAPADRPLGEALRESVRQKNLEEAERVFAALAQGSAEEAYNHLLVMVQDTAEVHRVVLPYRAWDLLEVIGKQHAHALLRQSVRYCVKSEKQQHPSKFDGPRTILPKLLEEHKLLGRAPGNREADEVWIERLSQTIFSGTPGQAADAVAAALAEGFASQTVGEALSLAANQLILRDHGRTEREVQPGKPPGSTHGDSIGVHACDSANAWRNMARASNPRNVFASLIVGAYQVAFDRTERGGDFLNWQPYYLGEPAEKAKVIDPEQLLREAEGAIRENDQARAGALIQRYGELGRPSRPVFDLLLRYAISEDGALHAEKYYRTVAEEFASTRPAFRWRQLVALARVTASEHGKPAPGYREACELIHQRSA